MNKNLIEKIAPQLTELMIKKMETLTEAWRKPWIADLAHGLPRNLRGTPYRGGNILMLLFRHIRLVDVEDRVIAHHGQHVVLPPLLLRQAVIVRQLNLLAGLLMADIQFPEEDREIITGLNPENFSPKDDRKAFRDACDMWWNGRTNDEKIRLWRQATAPEEE